MKSDQSPTINKIISEEKLTKSTLLESHKYLTILLKNTSDFIMISDETGLPVLYNEAYAQMIKTAFDIEMKPGLQLHKLFPNQKMFARWKGFHQRVLSGEQFIELYSHDFGNNITHYFEVSFTPIIEAGVVRGFSEITRDITEQIQFREPLLDTYNDPEERVRRHAAKLLATNEQLQEEILERIQVEEALIESEEKYNLIVNNSPDMTMLQNSDGIVAYVSPQCQSLLGLRPMELLGKNDISFVHSEDREKVQQVLTDVLTGKKIKEFEYRIIGNDGELRWVSHTAQSIKNNEEIAYIQSNLRNITRQKKAEEIIANQNIQLEQKNIALREFLTQLEKEKENLERKVITNIEKLIKPQLERLKSTDGEAQSYILDLIDHNLTEIISSFGIKMMNQANVLSPREIEICNMIKDGLSSKEIASILNLAKATVIRHRNNIRNKLGIRNTPTNLTVFLNSI